MSKTLQFTITTPEEIIFSEEINQVTIPTRMGEITILPDHISVVAELIPGELQFIENKNHYSLAVSGGFVEILPHKVTILADTAERSEEIDEKQAEEARKRAEKLIKEKRYDTEEFAALSAQIEIELVRVKVARKQKYRKLPPA